MFFFSKKDVALTPTVNALLAERNLTKHVWVNADNLKKAVTELLHLSTKDKEEAVLKASKLYGMARTEYREHFEVSFDPTAPVVPPKQSFGYHLPKCCKQLHITLQKLGVV